MNPKAVLVVLLNVENIHGFGAVPDGGANAVELSRSACQDIFFGKGTKRSNPRKPDLGFEDTSICGQIARGTRDHHVRVARQNDGTAEWCNNEPRIGKEDECLKSYALIGRLWVPCTSDFLGRCILDPAQAEEGCRESTAVCSILRTATEQGGPDIVQLSNSQSFHYQCSLLTDKQTCNARVFPITGGAAATDVFATCTWNGEECSGLGPHVCSSIDTRRKLGEDKQLQPRERQLQDEDACTATFSTEDACETGYVYSSGVEYDYISYSSTNLPPDLAICEWSQGACRTSRTCPYMCELTSDRNEDAAGVRETDATLTFGDYAITAFCEVDNERRRRQGVCESFYRVENAISGEALKQVVACRYAQGNGGSYCTREDRNGFDPCI